MMTPRSQRNLGSLCLHGRYTRVNDRSHPPDSVVASAHFRVPWHACSEEYMNVLRVWCVAVAALVGGVSSASAQSAPTGGLTGRVIDASQSAIPGVSVTATNTATNEVRTDVTNDQGVYRILALPVGVYQVAFRLDGFKTTNRSGVIIDASNPRSLEVQLEVGTLTETVTVSGDAPLLTPTSVATARSLTAAELEAVPTTTGSFTHLLSSEPGVSADLPARFDQRYGQYLAVGERHADDEHQPLLQRHRRDEPDHQ